MGLFGTRWVGSFRGHEIAVARNEWTKGFAIEWDGEEVGRRRWSWVGLGELNATVTVDGEDLEVHVEITMSGLDGECAITVGGEKIATSIVK